MATSQAYIEAREEGSEARLEGKKRSDNPHSILSEKEQYTGWEDGWEETNSELEQGQDDEED